MSLTRLVLNPWGEDGHYHEIPWMVDGNTHQFSLDCPCEPVLDGRVAIHVPFYERKLLREKLEKEVDLQLGAPDARQVPGQDPSS